MLCCHTEPCLASNAGHLATASKLRGWYAKYNGETSKSTWEVLNNGCCTAEKKHSALKINTFECIINANFSLMLHSILYFFPHCLTVFFFFLLSKWIYNVDRNFRKGWMLQKGRMEGGRWCACTYPDSFSCRGFLRAWTSSGKAKQWH